MVRTALAGVVVIVALQACAPARVLSGWTTGATQGQKRAERLDTIARAQVWAPANVAAMDITSGPTHPLSFPFRATVNCSYKREPLSGRSPKFSCERAEDDDLKVKYGGTNAEVYGEVLATRLLWALGFGADGMYPVRIVCTGCPDVLGGIRRDTGEAIFDPATVERKMPGRELAEDVGWSWLELEHTDPERGGAPRAHRDALKLLAVFMQHTDSKPQQQRILCLEPRAEGEDDDAPCEKPFLMINDLGLTFGRANTFNANEGAVNLVQWAATPVWKPGTRGCVGNLPKSLTGTLDNPVISEEGRRFLADLLMQLTDQQIHDLFDTARVTLRVREPARARSGLATVSEWVDAFKAKRAEIVDRRCD